MKMNQENKRKRKPMDKPAKPTTIVPALRVHAIAPQGRPPPYPPWGHRIHSSRQPSTRSTVLCQPSTRSTAADLRVGTAASPSTRSSSLRPPPKPSTASISPCLHCPTRWMWRPTSSKQAPPSSEELGMSAHRPPMVPCLEREASRRSKREGAAREI